jgi:hypothetical protein
MGPRPFFAYLLANLKLLEQPDHSRTKDQAYCESGDRSPGRAKRDLLKQPQTAQAVVNVLK